MVCLFQSAQDARIKKQQEFEQYQIILTEIEIWIKTTVETIQTFVLPTTEEEIHSYITRYNLLKQELSDKEHTLSELTHKLEEFKKYPDLEQLVVTLLTQLETLTFIFEEQKTLIVQNVETLQTELVRLEEVKLKSVTPDLSLEATLDSTSMPIEEPEPQAQNLVQEVITAEKATQPLAESETQTGRSLSSPDRVIDEEPVTKDIAVSYNQPIDVEIQTQFSDTSSELVPAHRETISIVKHTSGDHDTIEIATRPMADPEPIIEEPDDLLIEANYTGRPQSETRVAELNITSAQPNQPFETVFVEPDETTTEVIVDPDGTKRIIVKKLHRTVVRQQQSVRQQQLTTLQTVTDGSGPPVTQSFSQLTLEGQESSTSIATGYGRKETITTQQYGGKVVTGVPGGEVDVKEFKSEPEVHYSVVEGGPKPAPINIQDLKLHQGDVALVDNEQNQLVPLEQSGSQIQTSSSSVRAVVQQVTRRIIRKTRRIVRKIVIIDGKEHVTEEVIEEPEEVEVTEEGIPRVSINVTRTENGQVVQEQHVGQPDLHEVINLKPDEGTVKPETPPRSTKKPKKTKKAKSTSDSPSEKDEAAESSRYVTEQSLAPEHETLTITDPITVVTSPISDFIEQEKASTSSTVIEEAPTPEKAPKRKKKKSKGKAPSDEPSVTLTTDKVTVSVLNQTDVASQPEGSEKTPEQINPTAPPFEEVVETYLQQEMNNAALHDFILGERLHDPQSIAASDIETSKLTDQVVTLSIQDPQTVPSAPVDVSDFLAAERQSVEHSPDQNTLKQPQTVQIDLSLVDKNLGNATSKASISLTVEEATSTTADVLSKDINVQLPSAPPQESVSGPIEPEQQSVHKEESSPSDIDHGGTKGKRKKKSGSESTVDESRDTSLAESTEIVIPEDSTPSEATPKPSTEEFHPEVLIEETESASETAEYSERDTGYEADKTLDESLPDPQGDKHRRRKKKRGQKVKVKDSEESNVPKSVYETTPIGESEPDENANDIVQPAKKDKKRKKGKRKLEDYEGEVETEEVETTEPEPQPWNEALEITLASPSNESLHTLSTISEPGTVKIVEEGIPSRPTSESPHPIGAEIVHTVPVIEAVITQESTVQTTTEYKEPSISETTTKSEAVTTELATTQTSPDVIAETVEVATEPELIEKAEAGTTVQPEIDHAYTQIITEVAENVTQTSPKPDTLQTQTTLETTDTSIQTITPPQVESVDEILQTVTPEKQEDVPRSETAIQTLVVDSKEDAVQTQTPEPVLTIEMASQAQPSVVELSMQTSPSPQKITDEVQTSPVHFTAQVIPASTSESVAQTSPVSFATQPELPPTPTATPTKSSSDEYEVQVQASVFLPPDSSEAASESTITPGDESTSEASSGEFDVDVNVDAGSIGKQTFNLIEAEKSGKKKRKRRKHKKQPDTVEDEEQKEKYLFSVFHRQASGVEVPQYKATFSDITRAGLSFSELTRQPEVDETEDIVTPLQNQKVVIEETGIVTEPLDKQKPSEVKGSSVTIEEITEVDQKSVTTDSPTADVQSLKDDIHQLPEPSGSQVAEVFSKVVTDIDQEKIRQIKLQKEPLLKTDKPESPSDQTLEVQVDVQVSKTVPTGIEITTQDTFTVTEDDGLKSQTATFTVDSMLTETELKEKLLASEEDSKSHITTTVDFLVKEQEHHAATSSTGDEILINDKPVKIEELPQPATIQTKQPVQTEDVTLPKVSTEEHIKEKSVQPAPSKTILEKVVDSSQTATETPQLDIVTALSEVSNEELVKKKSVAPESSKTTLTTEVTISGEIPQLEVTTALHKTPPQSENLSTEVLIKEELVEPAPSNAATETSQLHIAPEVSTEEFVKEKPELAKTTLAFEVTSEELVDSSQVVTDLPEITKKSQVVTTLSEVSIEEPIKEKPVETTLLSAEETIEQVGKLPEIAKVSSEADIPEEKPLSPEVIDSYDTAKEISQQEVISALPEVTVTTEELIKEKPLALAPSKSKFAAGVTIEEVIDSPAAADSILPNISDSPPTPPEYAVSTWKPTETSVATQPATLNELNIRWNQTQSLERIKNLQNAKRTTHLSSILYIATLNEVLIDQSIEQRNNDVEQNLSVLRQAVQRGDVTQIQQTVIITVETITTWLETIEYRIYQSKQQTADGPSKERVEEFNNLKQEIAIIENKVDDLQLVLQQADPIYSEEDRQRMHSYIESLQQQVRIIEDVTEENEQLASGDLKRWNDFVRDVDAVTNLNHKLRRQLSDIKESDHAPQTKLNELDELETENRAIMAKSINLIATAKSILRDFPGRQVPTEVYSNHEQIKQLEHYINVEKEKSLQFLSLADDYEQTLKEFSQIIEIAEALVESPIQVKNLEHLEDEMQNHRKFFVNLSHCRAILESLEENLDSETRSIHSRLHQDLYERAKLILDKSTGRFQLMSLAASRWTILEQGTREEMRWLQVAQQRIPDLNSVTSSDYDRYIDLHHSLAADIGHHHAKLEHLNEVAQKLQELVVCSGLEQTYTESLEIITRLHEDVQSNLTRLLSFGDSWTMYNSLSDKVEAWLREAQIQLKKMEIPSGPRGHIRQFWVSCIIYYSCFNFLDHLSFELVYQKVQLLTPFAQWFYVVSLIYSNRN